MGRGGAACRRQWRVAQASGAAVVAGGETRQVAREERNLRCGTDSGCSKALPVAFP